MSILSNLEPQIVWHYFEEITRIPRPSNREEKIIAYLINFAKINNLDYKCDNAGNVVILKRATQSKQGGATVILQSHMDMVCEKNSDVEFDFMTQPINVEIRDGWVGAKGTTLGADCGIGMAAALAMLASTNIEHPALEALFTVNEEMGLTGAFELETDMLSGKYLINLDSEDDGEIFIGCAGGIDTFVKFTYTPEQPSSDYTFYTLKVSGLKGGHSGDDINKGRANSNRVAAQLLYRLKDYGVVLSDFDGGNLRNAIPREAKVVFGVESCAADQVEAIFEEYNSGVCGEFAISEPDIKLTLEVSDAPNRVVNKECTARVIGSLVAVVNGVLEMSLSMPGLVETSSNLASVKMPEDGVIQVAASHRSSVEIAKSSATNSFESTFILAGAEVTHTTGYPGWNPNPKSHLLEVTKESYQTLFGEEPKIKAIHAGLECGLFLQKYPELEMVSFGPTLRGVHSPDEKIEISTVDKFWRLLQETVKAL